MLARPLNLTQYEWDPETEQARFTWEDRAGTVFTEIRPAPLRTPSLEEATAGYVAALFFWLETQRG
jgi:hypothetical protein